MPQSKKASPPQPDKAQDAYYRQIRTVFGNAAGRKLLAVWKQAYTPTVVMDREGRVDVNRTLVNAAVRDHIEATEFELKVAERSK